LNLSLLGIIAEKLRILRVVRLNCFDVRSLIFFKKAIFSALLLGLVLGMVHCSRQGNESRTGRQGHSPSERIVDMDLDKILERGVIRAIVDNSSTSYFIYKGQPMGYEYELLMRLGKHLGVKVEIIITPNIEESFRMLNAGEADIIAYPLTVTGERKERIAFTQHYYTTRQVLVQRKPENYRKMNWGQVEKRMIRNQTQLAGKQVHVRKGSAFVSRLKSLSDEIGGDILILESEEEEDSETLIRKVADGEIAFTVADEDVARLNTIYFPQLDIKTPLSLPQKISWGIRKNHPQLESALNTWIEKIKRSPQYYAIYNRYFKNTTAQKVRVTSDYSSMQGGRLSKYDELIKEAADTIGWDWRLIAAIIYHESRYGATETSWAGAVGLMQLMPATGKRFGATNLRNPRQNIQAGTGYLRYLDKHWAKTVEDSLERVKFVLASYNVGHGHVIDAQKLTEKYAYNPAKWEDVESFLLKKSKAKYYQDPVVTSGYCLCIEPVRYVSKVISTYEQYLQLVPEAPII
jgi:membrane-bound lytic murein transglycosylase F